MSGAIALAGIAALRSGAGLVTVATPESCQDLVAAYEPSYMTCGLPSTAAGTFAEGVLEQLLQVAEKATAAGCGPGIGRSEGLSAVIWDLFEQLPLPAVFDADALAALAARRGQLGLAKGPRILTPHEGELGCLIDRPAGDRQECERQAQRLAGEQGLVVVLKGHRTLVTDGERSYYNPTGNPGMATGGSGDVLTGVITALLCANLAAWDAARLGAYLHGMAGDLAAEEKGEISLIASDIAAALPAAIIAHHRSTSNSA
jgi:NAD(P)H-hydrate epimerase